MESAVGTVTSTTSAFERIILFGSFENSKLPVDSTMPLPRGMRIGMLESGLSVLRS